MGLLGDIGLVETRFGLFRDSVNLGTTWCTVWDERTMGSEIVLGTPDGTPIG
jgi:hypothetical protein